MGIESKIVVQINKQRDKKMRAFEATFDPAHFHRKRRLFCYQLQWSC
jgi:hypothetical protein